MMDLRMSSSDCNSRRIRIARFAPISPAHCTTLPVKVSTELIATLFDMVVLSSKLVFSPLQHCLLYIPFCVL
jgi:hypothetical protein